MKLEETVQKFVDREIKIRPLKNILELILEGREKIKEKKEDVDKKAKDICKKIVECTHPVASKLLNMGYIKGSSAGKMMHNIKEIIKEMLKTEEEEMKGREKLKKELEKYKENIKNYLLAKIGGEVG